MNFGTYFVPTTPHTVSMTTLNNIKTGVFMKSTTMPKQLLIGLSLVLTLYISACKEVSVGVDDDDLDRIENIFGGDNDDNNETVCADCDNSDSEESSDTDSDQLTGDPTDPNGGLEYWDNSKKGSNRYFVGTYEIKDYYTSCNDTYWGPGLELPAVLRAYSYGDRMDFETSLSQLVWGAIIYPDETFDFQTNYLDTFGNPSVSLTCTCAMNDSYYGSDYIDCACTASNDPDPCDIYYQAL